MPVPEGAFIHGDCMELLPAMDAESVDSVITDPPYEISFLNRGWDATGIAFRPAVWREMLRVAKPGAYLLAFGAPRTVHRIAVAIEDAGWEIRDQLVWGYASGMPKSGDVALDFDRRFCPLPAGHRRPRQPLDEGDHVCPPSPEGDPFRDWSAALKPAFEPIVMARKPFSGSVIDNLLRHGTGALNIGATRIPVSPDDPVNEAVWTTAPSAIRPETPGFITSNEVGDRSPTRPPDAGRWPSNVILTDPILDGGYEGVVGGGQSTSSGWRPDQFDAHDSYSGSYGAFHDPDMPEGGASVDAGTYSRFFLLPKASRSDREPILPGPTRHMAMVDLAPHASIRRCVNCGSKRIGSGNMHICRPDCSEKVIEYVTVDEAARVNTHTTVKPLALMEHLVRLVTPPGGLVLDPFAGSGTTALAADGLGYRWLAFELEEEHVQIAQARLRGRQRGLGL